MLKVSIEKWNQSSEILREFALHHEHPRTRERFWHCMKLRQAKPPPRLAGKQGETIKQ